MTDQATETPVLSQEELESIAGGVSGAEANPGSDYTFNKPMNFPQLRTELMQALPKSTFQFHAEKTDGTPFGPDNALTISVFPTSTAAKSVNAVLNAHVPNEDWYLTPEQVALKQVAIKTQEDGFSALSDEEKDTLLAGVAALLATNPTLTSS